MKAHTSYVVEVFLAFPKINGRKRAQGIILLFISPSPQPLLIDREYWNNSWKHSWIWVENALQKFAIHMGTKVEQAEGDMFEVPPIIHNLTFWGELTLLSIYRIPKIRAAKIWMSTRKQQWMNERSFLSNFYLMLSGFVQLEIDSWNPDGHRNLPLITRLKTNKRHI